ncbi:hypothetical protein QWZ06_15915 [Chryseobacterium tructae]|uniref:Uncharacterized protein n=1 Tax=Chryseobacterium tructae TaxID=1037380 RepID=A0ABV7XZM5_9FLAO|nr:hypothetical protein [Chryseobacterium tructae]MDN3693671.1 hypothetical protein [Chryseobacterium tructae]
MTKKSIKVFIVNVILLSVLACVLGLTDDVFQEVYTSSNILTYCMNAMQYFLFWVLPYWWAMIIAGAVILTILYEMIRNIIKNTRA